MTKRIILTLVIASISVIYILETTPASAAGSGYAHLFEMAGQTWEIPTPLIKAIA